MVVLEAQGIDKAMWDSGVRVIDKAVEVVGTLGIDEVVGRRVLSIVD